jgi:2-desacetyl-2-hydroxyethyl bacteriochlorophyllide A dehydrogenase
MNALWFTAPRRVEIRPADQPAPQPGSLLVETVCSAISPGTEMMIYRGEIPRGMAADASIPALSGELAYPLQYGYAAVGRVTRGSPGDAHLTGGAPPVGSLVFAFQPHQSHFHAPPSGLIPIPEDLTPEQAVFLPNIETAVNFVMDGAPLIGERVAVIGQGVVGLLTTALLAQFPLAELVTFDKYPLRREASLKMGAHQTWPATDGFGNFDLVYELSGSPAALDDAIALCGFGGRIILGSWYGQKRAPVDLGGHFHRSRIQIISSQVSTLAPALSGRWTKERRFGVAWDAIRRIQPETLITHRFPFARAADAYRLLDEHPGTAIQPLLIYNV